MITKGPVLDIVREQVALYLQDFHTNISIFDEVKNFSDREREVFKFMGRGWSPRRLSELLGISVKTIDTYQSQIKNKIGVDDAFALRRIAVLYDFLTETQDRVELSPQV